LTLLKLKIILIINVIVKNNKVWIFQSTFYFGDVQVEQQDRKTERFFVAKESSKIVSKVKSKNVVTVVMVLSLWGLMQYSFLCLSMDFLN
jgi:hypothetical protein